MRCTYCLPIVLISTAIAQAAPATQPARITATKPDLTLTEVIAIVKQHALPKDNGPIVGGRKPSPPATQGDFNRLLVGRTLLLVGQVEETVVDPKTQAFTLRFHGWARPGLYVIVIVASDFRLQPGEVFNPRNYNRAAYSHRVYIRGVCVNDSGWTLYAKEQ